MDKNYLAEQIISLQNQINETNAEIEKTKTEIDELDKKIECCMLCKHATKKFSLISELSIFVSDAKINFSNGGYVDNGVGLLDILADNCIKKINDIETLIVNLKEKIQNKFDEYNNSLNEKKEYLSTLHKKLRELQSKISSARASFYEAADFTSNIFLKG